MPTMATKTTKASPPKPISDADPQFIQVSVLGRGNFSAAEVNDLVLEAVSLAEGRREGQEEGQEWEGQAP